MEIIFVVIYGAITGFVISCLYGTDFGLGWDIYLGILGSVITNLLILWLYYAGVLPTINLIVGLNLFSVCLDITGAFCLIYLEVIYSKLDVLIETKKLKVLM